MNRGRSTRSKYHNRKVMVDGVTFDSKREARRYCELKVRADAGEIAGLVLQPRFELQPGFEKGGKKYRKIEYVADFMYTDLEIEETFVEDVKGMKTDVYKLKKKLFEYQFPNLNITEI